MHLKRVANPGVSSPNTARKSSEGHGIGSQENRTIERPVSQEDLLEHLGAVFPEHERNAHPALAADDAGGDRIVIFLGGGRMAFLEEIAEQRAGEEQYPLVPVKDPREPDPRG